MSDALPQGQSIETVRANVKALSDHSASLQRSLLAARQHVASSTRQKRLFHAITGYYTTARAARHTSRRWFGWVWAGVFICSLAIGGLFTVATSSVAIGAVGLVLGLSWSGCLFYLPSDSRLDQRTEEMRNRLAILTCGLEAAEQEVSRLTAEHAECLDLHRRWSDHLHAIEQRQSRRYRLEQLVRQDWKALRSIPFEQFLELVFRELGYSVEATKVSGDQGGDLIVAHSGWRAAIQVKGYFNSVSNGAVQEAYAAQGYYSCDACAVITNSRFTASARDLAKRLKCVLIDEDSLPRLILGELDLLQECHALRNAGPRGTTSSPHNA